MTMFSSGALVENPSEPQTCLIHETFTAIVEAKAVKSVVRKLSNVQPQHDLFTYIYIYPVGQ